MTSNRIVSAALFGCLVAATAAAQTTRVPTEQDGRAATEIERRFSADRSINAQWIDIDVRGGDVRLTGRVTTEEAKLRAGDLAADVEGVDDVRNDLTVGTGGAVRSKHDPGSIPEEMPGTK
jgi:osmotically-inducible protein OsmY